MRRSELRQLVRQRKRQFSQQQLAELSLPVLARLRPLLSVASTVLLYYSLPDEVDTHAFLDELRSAGKIVLLPRVVDEGTMVLHRYTGRADLSEGAFGIMEPVGEPFTDYAAIDVALIPGVAFDAAGRRLGRGRGYYDRFLRQLPRARRVGVCFPFQRVAEVPAEPHDVSVDEVV